MRILSGIQPSGEPHLGNYFAAIRRHIAYQEEHEAIYFLADYHSMTTLRDAAERRRLTRALAIDYLACGLDPERAILYRQSDFPELCELAWMLGTVTPLGLLERAHSYKDKVAQGLDADCGLFTYPVLMAADILIYRPQRVPVGRDQKQHLEIARDIAQRFNHCYGAGLLHLPEPDIAADVAWVPGTDGRKMSKSYHNAIPMFAPEREIKKAVMGIVTDSSSVAAPKDVDQPLFALWGLFAEDEERRAFLTRVAAGGVGYGEVKRDLLRRLLAHFAPLRERREAWAARPDDVEDVLAAGVARARTIGLPVLAEVRRAAGLGAVQARAR